MTLPVQIAVGNHSNDGEITDLQGSVMQMLARLAPIPSVMDNDHGAKGDGFTDDASAFSKAMAASRVVFVPDPPSAYVFKSKLTIPANTWLVGMNKRTTKIKLGYAGDLIEMGDGAGLMSLSLDGDGANFAGRGLIFSSTNGRQTVRDCDVTNFNGACFFFGVSAGSQSSFFNIRTSQTSGASGSGNYAIVIDPTQQLSAVPRKFAHLETNGFCAFDFGGSNDTFVTGSFLGDLNFTTDTRGLLMHGCRVANQSTLTIMGHNNAFVGCDFTPLITIDSACDHIMMMGNSYNNLPITENQADVNGSNRATNNIDFSSRTWAPAWSASPTPPAIGNGSITGKYTRIGNLIVASVEIVAGSTTTFGAGDWSISLPVANGAGLLQMGVGYAFDQSATTNYPVAIVFPSGASTVSVRAQAATGSASATIPFTWATSDTLRFTISYQVV